MMFFKTIVRSTMLFLVGCVIPVLAVKVFRVMMDPDPLATGPNWLDNWKPTFEDYLGAEVSLILGENVTFKLSATTAAPPDQIVANKSIDLYFAAPQNAACYEAQYYSRSLLTIRKYIPVGIGQASFYGGIIIANASNARIQTMSDIKDSIVGMEGTFTWGSSIMQQAAFLRNGLHVYLDAKQVIAGDGYARPFQQPNIVNAVHSGIIDIGFVRSDTLAALVASNLTKSSYFKILGAVNVTFPGTSEQYPFPVSTPLFPEWSLIALPQVDETVMAAVANALLRLTSTSYPAFRARYASWQWSAVYDRVSEVLEDAKLMVIDSDTLVRQCLWFKSKFTSYDMVNCPTGTFKIPESEAINNCLSLGLSCPVGHCWCKPCKKAALLELYLDNTGDKYPQNICSKMSVCLRVVQGVNFQPSMIDNTYTAQNLNASYRIRYLASELEPGLSGAFQSTEALPWVYTTANLSLYTVGMYSVEVFIGSEQIDSSPFLLTIDPVPCGDGRVPNLHGQCQCGDGAVPVAGLCVLPLVVGFIVLAALVAPAGLAYLSFQRKEDESEKQLRAAVDNIRKKLRISRRDGFVLNTEKLPSSFQTIGFIRKAYVEAAARLSLFQGFDIKHLDAFCMCLQGEESSLYIHSSDQDFKCLHSQQYRLLCEWLLQTAAILLQPKAETVDKTQDIKTDRATCAGKIPQVFQRLTSKLSQDIPIHSVHPTIFSSERARRASAGLNNEGKDLKKFARRKSEVSAESPADLRFRYFQEKVIKLQIWSDHDNSLFVELKKIVQELMSNIARDCDVRYAALGGEHKGIDLLSLMPPPVQGVEQIEEKNRASTSEISRSLEAIGFVRTVEQLMIRLFFRTWEEPAAVSRQDHSKVRAIRVDESDKAEADLQRTASGNSLRSCGQPSSPIAALADILVSPSSVLNEDVFLSQLSIRAHLLNAAFQDKIFETVLSHGIQQSLDRAAKAHRGMMNAASLSLHNSSTHSVHGDAPITVECMFEEGPRTVELHAAPVKKMSRMREKLSKYAPPHPRCEWPLAANILDPVRTSVVCSGPSQILQVLRWFTEHQEANSLAVCRVKSKFAQSAYVVDGYRDLSVSVVFVDSSGLCIIGEVQVHDQEMHKLKLQMHKLYKIKRAADPSGVTG